ncbi:DUF3310 domain-containing protein [Listeria booriae]|uniref:DUF3310 domain-containing protein n=2 Tax=Listeria booriae TaxID=1552123 RepID=A0A842AJP9_9LIST|nr:DUF3310 domain-containing protein [Listeria booriae]
MNDNISPAHYQQGGIETIDFMKAKLSEEELRGYLKANVLKYITREGMKNGLEDLKKAQWYLDYLIALAENKPFKSRSDIDSILEKHDALETGLQDLHEHFAKKMGLPASLVRPSEAVVIPRQFLFGPNDLERRTDLEKFVEGVLTHGGHRSN